MPLRQQLNAKYQTEFLARFSASFRCAWRRSQIQHKSNLAEGTVKLPLCLWVRLTLRRDADADECQDQDKTSDGSEVKAEVRTQVIAPEGDKRDRTAEAGPSRGRRDVRGVRGYPGGRRRSDEGTARPKHLRCIEGAYATGGADFLSGRAGSHGRQ